MINQDFFNIPPFDPEAKIHDLARFKIGFSEFIPEPEPIIKQGETLVISRGNISTISGAAKSRKSMFVSTLVATFFGSTEFGMSTGVENGTCLLFDTESSKAHCQKQLKRIYRLMKWTAQNDKLVVFHLRECEIKERLEIIEQAINETKPDFVIVDGLLDCLIDPNNIAESNDLIQLLMKLSSVHNLHLTSILHTGKSNGGNMLGWVGGYSQRKSETVFEVVKDGDSSTVKPKETRNAPFDEFNITINNEGIPEFVGNVVRKTASEINDQNTKRFLTRILVNKQMNNTDLLTEYIELNLCSLKTAQNHIKKMLLCGFIHKDDKTKLYRLARYDDE